MNQVKLTLTKIGGNTVSEARLFDASKMEDIKQVGSAIEFRYKSYEDEQSGAYVVYKTGPLTLDQLKAASNTQASEGTLRLVGYVNSTSGFAIGAHDVLDASGNPLVIPNKARIISGFYEVATTFTSATDAATIAFGVATDAATGLKAATAISTGTTYDATGAAVLFTPVYGTTSTYTTKTTGARNVQYTIASETVTAGQLVVYVDVVVEGV